MSNVKFLQPMLVVLLSASIFSCSKKSENFNYIPNKVNVVAILDLKSLYVKSDEFKYLKGNSTFQEIAGTPEQLKHSGIDIDQKGFIFGEAHEDRSGYMAFMASLSDDVQFEKYVKQIDPAFQITTEGELKLASKPNEKKAIGWNSGTAIYIVQNNTSASSHDQLLSFFNLKKEESLDKMNETYQTLQKKNSDVLFWLRLENLGKKASAYVPLVDFKNTFVTASCNFEKGQMIIDLDFHSINPDSQRLDLTKGTLSKDLAKALPADSLVAMIGVSLDMDKIYAYLEKGKYVDNAEAIAQQSTGLTTKEIFQMLSGEIAATVNGVEIIESKQMDWLSGEEVMKKTPKPEYAIAIGIRDKVKASQVISKLSELKILQNAGGYYAYDKNFFLIDKGSSVIITGSEAIRDASINGKSATINSELSNMLTDNAGAFYLNVKDLPEELLELGGDQAKEYIHSTQVESIKITGSAVKGNTSSGKLVMTFLPKEENSLVTITRSWNKTSTIAPATSAVPGLRPEELQKADSLPK